MHFRDFFHPFRSAPQARSPRLGRRASDIVLSDADAASHSRLRELSSALLLIREEERSRIARELHDDLGQVLATLRMDLALMQSRPQASGELIKGMDERLQTAIASLRRIAANLRPRALDEGGLHVALLAMCREFEVRYGIICTLSAQESQLRLGDADSTAVYRIVQEALSNVARHAGARSVAIVLDRRDGQLLLSVRDDGRGIDSTDLHKPGSLGLVGMRERVWAIQGNISISSDDAPGTRIDISLPIKS